MRTCVKLAPERFVVVNYMDASSGNFTLNIEGKKYQVTDTSMTGSFETPRGFIDYDCTSRTMAELSSHLILDLDHGSYLVHKHLLDFRDLDVAARAQRARRARTKTSLSGLSHIVLLKI